MAGEHRLKRRFTFQQWLKPGESLCLKSARIILNSPNSARCKCGNGEGIQRLRAGLGHAMSLDHYGQSFSSTGYLKSMRPDYVKIDQAYTGELKDKKRQPLLHRLIVRRRAQHRHHGDRGRRGNRAAGADSQRTERRRDPGICRRQRNRSGCCK